MKTSQLLLATLKETPAEAELASHRLMIRAGLIRRLASGIYTWLPLGLRVLKKVTTIVREEMDRSGALEIAMPFVQPAELWQQSTRWEDYGPELLRLTDRHKNAFCLGPTHEEVITQLASQELRSYKQVPINFYQIQMKFRDEIRPRFGVMRAREFLMKDAYSFDIDEEGMRVVYQKMYDTYVRIFTRLDLKYRAVLADTGAIGGNYSHEFQVLADVGEDTVVYSDSSDYAANLEKAEALPPQGDRPLPSKAMEKIPTPGIYTVPDLAKHLNISAEQSVKTLVVKGRREPLVALILRGDHTLNPIKAEHLPEVAVPLTLAEPEEIKRQLGCRIGSLGPVGLSIPYIVDRDAAQLSDFVCGANEEDFHLKNVNWERDAAIDKIADIRQVVEGDLSPDGQGHLCFSSGIEVGHIFQLGDRYSKKMGALVLNEAGERIPLQMGCYGIGVSRIVAAAIEQNHDERGIIWPESIAPFTIALVPVSHQSSRVQQACAQIYEALMEAGYEVLWDDRKERLGVLLADMDLIGIPHRLIVGERGLEKGIVEYKTRRGDVEQELPLQDIVSALNKWIR